MSHHHGSSSSSSSSVSEDCGPCCSEASCHEKSCCISTERPVNPGILACKYQDAAVVVTAQSTFIASQGTATTQPVTDDTPLGRGTRIDIVTHSTGVFIKEGYILTTATAVMVPPAVIGLAQRWPYVDPSNTETGQIYNGYVRCSQCFVTVGNVNNTGKSYTYPANIVAVGGALDLALLEINYGCCDFNSLPKLRFKKPKKGCIHPYLKLAKSCSVCPGQPVYLLGSYSVSSNGANQPPRYGASLHSIVSGTVTDEYWLDPNGQILYPSVLINSQAFAPSVGCGVINGEGHLITVQTLNIVGRSSPESSLGNGVVGGVDPKMLRHFLNAVTKDQGSCCTDPHILNVVDSAGPYVVYRKGYLGVAYTTAPMPENVTVDYTSGSPALGNVRIRYNANGEPVNVSRGNAVAEGIQVIGMAGLNPTDSIAGVPGGLTYVPGGATGVTAPLVADAPVSYLLSRMSCGDRILSLQKVGSRRHKKKVQKIGSESGELAPSSVLWKLKSGDEVVVAYQKTGEYVLNNESNSGPTGPQCCIECTATKVTVQWMPPVLDYPYGSIEEFPLLEDYGFGSLNGQILNPQYPALQSGILSARFRPAV